MEKFRKFLLKEKESRPIGRKPKRLRRRNTMGNEEAYEMKGMKT